ncbi:RNase adapter RapZ [Pseudoflavonifractor sp. An85]|uniref:RNase adapter RapZ n=1 Tax=Pseudoflavonifractor sp. An85 TaxID=1965661 RepID=UPI000B38E40C|nr:RNase adapter RapZ [Pseudoflavonifractor sp. An85]OUN23438.1 RNase adaptor protein RapZ [Pseudoflavonifractor sp. An85]
MQLFIVSGLSGAGKSTVMSILEDSGYFCVDNLPPALIPKFAELSQMGNGEHQRAAVVCDIRGGSSFVQGLFEALDTLDHMKTPYEILFVEAEDETIIKRYKETRRSHPLMDEMGTLAGAVEAERKVMEPVRNRADIVLQTDAMSTRKLRDRVLELVYPGRKKDSELNVCVTSFGFKYGLPMEADMVFDVRFLPNPFYVENLRPHTGLDEGVRDYVFQFSQSHEFLEKMEDMVSFLLPQFVEEGKSMVVVAIGCTGGKHRSVAMTHALAQYIEGLGYRVSENHRDMTRA